MSHETQQISRWRAAFAESDPAPDPRSCPTPETLWAAVLRWSPLAGAVAYDVQVSTEDLRAVVAAKGQTATEYRVPESALAGLPPGARLLWQVDAVRPDGTHENSPTFVTPLK